MEIQRADPQRRRQALTTLLVFAVAGVIGMFVLQRWLGGLEALPAAEARAPLLVALAWILASTCLLVVALGACAWRFGSQVRSGMQYPPRGTRVIRDTAVLHGEAAQRRGRWIQALGGALVSCGVVLVLVSLWLYQSLAAAGP